MHILHEHNKLINKYPKVAEEYDIERNEEPLNMVYATGKKKYWWKCKKCGRSWEAATYNRTKNGTGCPYCCNVSRKAHEGYCLASERPEMLEFWDYEKNEELGCNPYNTTPFSSKKYWWRCPHNKEHRYYGKIGQKCTECKQEKREAREKNKKKKSKDSLDK